MTRCAAIFVILFFSLSGALSAEVSLEAQAQKLGSQLLAPCCYTGTVEQHPSAIAWKIRKDIRDRLSQGMTPSAIREAYVAQFGERILVPATPHGLYVMAFAIFAGGLVVVIVLLKHFQSRSPAPSISAEQIARIEREIEKSR